MEDVYNELHSIVNNSFNKYKDLQSHGYSHNQVRHNAKIWVLGNACTAPDRVTPHMCLS